MFKEYERQQAAVNGVFERVQNCVPISADSRRPPKHASFVVMGAILGARR
jgi:hypothetical protein